MSHTEFRNSAIAKEQQNEPTLRECVVMSALFVIVMTAVVTAFAYAI